MKEEINKLNIVRIKITRTRLQRDTLDTNQHVPNQNNVPWKKKKPRSLVTYPSSSRATPKMTDVLRAVVAILVSVGHALRLSTDGIDDDGNGCWQDRRWFDDGRGAWKWTRNWRRSS